MNKSAEAFRTIGEVADELDVPKHVLRFWEGKFPQIRPMKRGGGRRYYRPEDMELLRGIRYLAPYGHDGRMQSLHDFTRDIVHNTFAGASLTEDEVSALAAYMMEFDFLPNPRLTRTGRLAEGASGEEKKGEKIFMSSGCNRCHDGPLRGCGLL